jgi:DNA-nicking Smr family endonuclease
MSKKGERRPKAEELALWREATKSARALGKRAIAPSGAKPEAVSPPAAARARPPLPKPAPVAIKVHAAKPLPAIEQKLLRDLRRGAQPVDARIDLHGYTQERARVTIERFLSHARARGYRLVLVVTGKGSAFAGEPSTQGERSERGVLRAMLPRWLALPPMSDWIVGLSQAGPRHGGEGALYIQLRRVRES